MKSNEKKNTKRKEKHLNLSPNADADEEKEVIMSRKGGSATALSRPSSHRLICFKSGDYIPSFYLSTTPSSARKNNKNKKNDRKEKEARKIENV